MIVNMRIIKEEVGVKIVNGRLDRGYMKIKRYKKGEEENWRWREIY